MIHPMIGKILQGRYQIVQILGAGVFGQTYVAEDIFLPGNPKSVIKQLKVNKQDPDYLETIRDRFERETHTLATLGCHERIPQLIASFEEEEEFYLVQEFIPGHSLLAELPINGNWGNRWREREVIEFLYDVLGTLEFVHRHGVIHCDIKPDNLIRRSLDHKLFLIDFGSVQPYDFQPNPGLPIFRVAVTSLGYIPPEQFSQQPQPNSDIYALGMIAIQALTGFAPMQLNVEPKTQEVIWRSDKIPVSNYLATILSQMVRYDYRQRYQSAAQVLEALKPLILPNKQLQLVAAHDIPTLEDIARIFDAELKLAENSENYQPQLLRNNQLELPLKNDVQSNDLLTNDFPNSDFPKPNFPKQNFQLRSNNTYVAVPESDQEKKSWIKTGVKAGILANSVLVGLGVYAVFDNFPGFSESDTLNKANKEFKKGDLDKALALAKSIAATSPIYPEAQIKIEEWQQEWQKAGSQIATAEAAYKDKKWSDVIDSVSELPDILYWRVKGEKLIEEARTNLETEANDLLAKAYAKAGEKDFSAALDYMRQIPEHTSAGLVVHDKLAEYAEKQQVRSVHLLQQAYNYAGRGNFTQALIYLHQIPKGSTVYSVAQEKLIEYTEKQAIQAQSQGGNISTADNFQPQLPEMNQPFINNPSATKLQDFQPGNQMNEVNIRSQGTRD